jgi:hypothetical protein
MQSVLLGATCPLLEMPEKHRGIGMITEGDLPEIHQVAKKATLQRCIRCRKESDLGEVRQVAKEATF